MKLSDSITFFAQIVLAILQFFGAFGSVYFLVYVILLFVEKSRNESTTTKHYYSDKDLIILLIIFIVSLITHLFGIFGSLRKRIYILVIFVILIALQTIIFFTSGLILCGVWNVISLFFGILLIALVQHELVVESKKKQQPMTIAGNTNQDYSYLDNSYAPPDYNSAVGHKPVAPPEYHSVDLIPVHPIRSMTVNNNNQSQRY